MCGIVGYIGNKIIDKELIETLKLLEYRGYDSSGVAVLKNHEIYLKKAEGNISCLEKLLDNEPGATLGIAHTRWATNGKPTVINAHPLTSQNKEWAVVHNGIIENFGSLKTELQNKNYSFISETDTEVIAHLLEDLKTENKLQILIDTCNKLKGSFALAVINKNVDNTIFLAKRKSPLYVATNETEVYTASDPICFAGKTKNYYALNDNEFCEAKINNLTFYNINGEKIVKKPLPIDEFEQNFGKQGYEHYMLKEIKETPSVLKRIVNTYQDGSILKKLDTDILNNINKIILVGCGTAYHACMMGEKFIENFAKIETRSYIASEFRCGNSLIDEKTLAIFVSQSGETADTIMAHELAKQKKAKTLALTNVLHSTLAKTADFVLPICAGPEVAVASTKAYTAQITILNILSKFLSNVKFNSNIDYIKDISNLADNISISSVNILHKLSHELIKENTVFFIGQGLDYITSEEANLKLKEITYINSQAYPAGELKHGFLALVEKGTYVFVIATQKEVLHKTLNAANEAAARGAKLVIVSQHEINASNLKNVHAIIRLSDFKQDLMPIITILTFQMLSYLTSVEKGINPDQPRNLAKSVTVE